MCYGTELENEVSVQTQVSASFSPDIFTGWGSEGVVLMVNSVALGIVSLFSHLSPRGQYLFRDNSVLNTFRSTIVNRFGLEVRRWGKQKDLWFDFAPAFLSPQKLWGTIRSDA